MTTYLGMYLLIPLTPFCFTKIPISVQQKELGSAKIKGSLTAKGGHVLPVSVVGEEVHCSPSQPI